MTTKVNRQIVIVDDAVSASGNQHDGGQVELELEPPTTSPRGFRLGRRETDRERLAALHTAQALQQRVADLEAQLDAEKARAPRLALAGLDAIELATLGSETAVMILGTARSEAAGLVADAQARHDAATIEADKLVADADQRAKNLFSEAKTKADKLDAETQAHAAELRERAETLVHEATARAETLVSEATARAETLVSEATAQAESLVSEATVKAEAARAAAVAEVERLREASEAEAAATHAKAEADAARIVKEATARRDSLISELEAQRRIVDAMIDDSSAVRAVLIEAYGKSRDTLELAIAKLNGPLDTAGRQAAAIAREIAAIQQ
jgi:cell division septum initiation protein DivIVA